MKQLLSLFLFLLPCLAWAQYPSNGNQKITLGEQTSADGLIWRGVASIDTVTATSKITRANKQDTSAFLLLDTVTNLLWHYKTASNGWIQAGGGTAVTTFSGGTTGLTPSTATSGAVTLGGTLAVANGGTGADMSSLPNNYLVRKNSSGVFDTAAIYEAGGNVGIGTASPNKALEISRGAGIAQLRISNNGATTYYTEFGDNGAIIQERPSWSAGLMGSWTSTSLNSTWTDNQSGGFQFNPRGVAAMTILGTGNLGIGTANPTFKLDVAGTARFTGSITSSAVNAFISTGGSSILSSQYTGTNGNWFTFQNAGGVHYIGIDNSAGTDFGATAYSMLFYTPSDRNIEFLSPSGKRMIIATGGNVGIGQTTPTAVLHLKAGTATASTAPLKFTSGTNLTTAEAGAMEFNGTNLFFSPSTTRHTVNHGLPGSATLNFPSTTTLLSADLTITVTGAADGDVVSLGVPNAAVNANTSYSAWVSAANTVTVRFNNYSSGTVDPASALFKVFVTK